MTADELLAKIARMVCDDGTGSLWSVRVDHRAIWCAIEREIARQLRQTEDAP